MPNACPQSRALVTRAALAALSCALTLGCGDSTPVDPPVATSVRLSVGALDFTALSDTSTLTATVLDQNGTAMPGATVAWTSDDASVAEVNSSGRVTAIADGTTSVSATFRGLSATASVTVAQALDTITVPTTLVLGGDGADTTLVAAAEDALGSLVAGATLSWVSADPAVVTVVDGLVTAVTDGSATVTVEASYGGTTVMVEINVVVNPTLVVVTTELDDGVPGFEYLSDALAAEGGSGQTTWALAAGSDPLPSGFSLSELGVITGLPSDTLHSTFTVQATSSDGQTATGAVTLVVAPQAVVPPGASCEDYSKYAQVSFDDALLSAYVLDLLGLAEESLTCEVASSVRELRPSQTGIASIAGLQNFPGLWTLEFFNNAVADLSPVAGMSELVRLDARENQISDVAPLVALGSLRTLWLENNPIANIDALTGLTGLVNLSLTQTQVGDAELSALAGMTAMEVLELDQLGLTDASVVSAMPVLRELSLRDNQLTSIVSFAGLTALQRLALGQNQISDVSSLAGLTSLTFLSLASNNITDITPLDGLTALESLYLSWNPLTTLTALSGLSGLEILLLDEVGVADLSPISGLAGLSTLRARTNGITSLSPLAALVGLEVLWLDGNALTSLDGLGSVSALRWISAASNQITDVSALGSSGALTFVSLQDNATFSDVSPLVSNALLGSGATVDLVDTSVACVDVAALEAKGVSVLSGC